MLPKNKIMLQIPVEKELGETWRKFVKMTGRTQTFLFEEMFCQFLEILNAKIEKGKEENVKS